MSTTDLPDTPGTVLRWAADRLTSEMQTFGQPVYADQVLDRLRRWVDELDVSRTFGPVREVLLVSPAAGRALELLREWRRWYEPRTAGISGRPDVERDLAAAVDALTQPDGGEFTWAEAIERVTADTERLQARRGALAEREAALDPGIDPASCAAVDRDRLQKQENLVRDLRARLRDLTDAVRRADKADAELAEVTADLSRTEEKLAEVTADRDWWYNATARRFGDALYATHGWDAARRERDAARDALESVRAIVCDPELVGIVERGVVGTSPETYSGVTQGEALEAMTTALCSARELLADPQPLDALVAKNWFHTSTLEKADSVLCDCITDDAGPPVSPATGELMDHHCDCTAVKAAEQLVGKQNTVHYGQCHVR